MNIKHGEQLYEGKAKIVYQAEDPQKYLIYYKDDATAFNGQKKGTVSNKGAVNNILSAHFFQLLESKGVPTHFIEKLDDRSSLVWAVEIIPVEVVVRNIVAGSLSKRLGIPEGEELACTVIEYYYKSDELGDPMINSYHVKALGLASEQEMSRIDELALRVNAVLKDFLATRELLLVDFKLEFGRKAGDVVLADEISPDTCRFWDARTRRKLDKDRFRRDLGDVEDAYAEVLRRVVG